MARCHPLGMSYIVRRAPSECWALIMVFTCLAWSRRVFMAAVMMLASTGCVLGEDPAPRLADPLEGVAVIWGGGLVPAPLKSRFGETAWTDVSTLSLPVELLDRFLITPGVTEQPVAAATVDALTNNPGLVGVWVPRKTALVTIGRTLEVVGAGTVTICLPPSATRSQDRPLLVRHLQAGARADLVALSRAAIARRGQRFPRRVATRRKFPAAQSWPAAVVKFPRECGVASSNWPAESMRRS